MKDRIHIVTATKTTPYGDESMMGAIKEAERLRSKTGHEVHVFRGTTLICTFLRAWRPR